MSVDVTKLTTSLPAQEEGVEVKLLDDEGEPIGAVIIVAGPDSKRAKKARAKLVQERTAHRIRTVTGERMDYESRFMAASACISWSGFTSGKEDFECNLANAMRLFEAKPEYQEQVDAVANNRTVFSKA